MKETFMQQCLEILKRDEVKKELIMITSPFFQLILNEIYPYIRIIVLLIVFIFLLLIIIITLLLFILRNN
jgi:hypothetical protein